MDDVLILGAGIVGIATGIHLLRRGRSVTLVDKSEPGHETSFGNAGIIQREGVRPHPFPRDLQTLLQVGLHLSTAARYEPLALPRLAPPLLRYWWESSPEHYRKVVQSYAPLIGRSIITHTDFIEACGPEAESLISRYGWHLAFRSPEKLEKEARKAQGDHDQFGIGFEVLDWPALQKAEPSLLGNLAGAIHWTDPWTVRDPGALVTAYFNLFEKLGGTFIRGAATGLSDSAEGWRAEIAGRQVFAEQAVIALGPWAPDVLDKLGYRLPLFVKRGYHMHYGTTEGASLNHLLLDPEVGYAMAPMARGIRITTGAEFAERDAAPTPIQLGKAEAAARELFPLGERLDPQPWKGARPCTPDMMPIISEAPKHQGLFVGIGHAHHGFTLGPATGELLAQVMTGDETAIDIHPFRMARFMGG
ncbi:D-amino-acid dehydrogenase [Devosia subaequoris]|uniref:D-amino-acid dehydrogenase n=1 Tax=Devosia subaequoris TaxID=395930 RepID=A0A7W6IP27_9HYPH|nr:FAD-binding oxidoreductase [Devosia subaequoris]MBB4053059.1 D-amino-acid dehydrogenase [Devosia subaequoris]MCP1210476.1 FAD-binding oxidoreductase [Devosia subaequoris]